MNPKQERFVQEYLIDLNATQAAMRAGYSAHTAKQQGSRLLTNDDVQEAIQTAQAEFRERMEVSKKSVTAQLDTAYCMARDNGQTAVMVQSTMGIAKVHGLLVDKTEDVTKPADMTEEQLAEERRGLEVEMIRLRGRNYLVEQITKFEGILALYDADQFESYAAGELQPFKH